MLEVGRQQTQVCRLKMYEACGIGLYQAVNKYDCELRGIPPAFKEELRKAFRPIWDSYIAGTPGAAEVVKALETFHEEYVKTKK